MVRVCCRGVIRFHWNDKEWSKVVDPAEEEANNEILHYALMQSCRRSWRFILHVLLLLQARLAPFFSLGQLEINEMATVTCLVRSSNPDVIMKNCEKYGLKVDHS